MGTSPGSLRRLELERSLPVPAGELWRHLTSPELLPAWIGRLSGEPTVGTLVHLAMSQEEGAPESAVLVRVCERPTHLAVSVDDWELEVHLSADGEGRTLLRFAHLLAAGLEPADVEPGWRFYLDRLTWAVEGRTGAEPHWADYETTGA